MRRLVCLISLAGCGQMGAMRQATLADNKAMAPVAPLAIGSRFYPEVATEIPGSATPNLRLQSADPNVLAVEDGALLAKSPGASAVLITTDEGAVIDFLHIWVAPVTKISLARRDGDRIDGAVGLTVGEDITLVPALWNGAQKLTGAGEVTWTVNTDGPLALLRDGSPDRRRLRARAPGKATVTVALGEATTTLDIEVLP